MLYRKFRANVQKHMKTIPAGHVQAEHMMRLEMGLRGDRWPLFGHRMLQRMEKQGTIKRGSDTRSFFRSGSGWSTWGPIHEANEGGRNAPQ